MNARRAPGEWDLIPNWVSEALAFHSDGRPMGRLVTGGMPEANVDPMRPEVIAFQGMVQDALGERGRPVTAVYGEKVLSLVPGRLVHVAAVLRGRPDRELRASMEESVRGIEAGWGRAISRWTGVPAEVEGLASGLAPVTGRTEDRGPGEVEDPMNARGVFPVSAMDFEEGMARLKVAVFSAGFAAVQGAYVELVHGREGLRLEASRPDHALTEEGSVRFPVVAPGEAASVACLLEPLVPGRHLVEGTITFFDDANNPRHLEVPPREFQVVFPRLSVEVPPDGLQGWVVAGGDSASRSWRYPASLGGVDVLRTARTVLGTRGLVLTSGEEDTGPPPSWSVEGRALAGNAPISVTMRVTGGMVRRIELTATSTEATVTAGAMAELRQLLTEAFFKRWRGQVMLEEETTTRRGPPPIPETDIDLYIPAR
jgi:hypothetical protein